ncbi:hypothetical protein [Nocardia sp. NPDC051832]|uniref:hypothetical protein n=1 Tax=Nocardia sp. NPDC051832 TaxID=3155673 RepID=UPI0034207F6E
MRSRPNQERNSMRRNTISYLLFGWSLPSLRAWRTHRRLIGRIYLTWPEVTTMCDLNAIITTPTVFDRAAAFPPSTGRRRARLPRIRRLALDDPGALVLELEPQAGVTEKKLTAALCTIAYEWDVPEERLTCGITESGIPFVRLAAPITLVKDHDR